ncbi:MAG: PAC2 family protein [Actinomycetota bacterium]|nr:PAC2 family protein [Actinomycetota bacterium]
MAVYGVIEEEPVARPARPEDLYTLHGSPSLQDPVLLIHLTGWIDAGLCAHEATETILGQIAPVIVAEFETEWLLDHRARRPTMHIVEGVNVGLDWPEITLVSGRDATGNDVLVLHGAEPDHNWRSFCDAVVSLSQRFGVRRVIGLGSYPASSPHTRPSRLSVTAATPDLASLGFTPATLDVPAGMQAALEMAHHAAGIESVGLWAQVPHYISGAHYPAASLALVDGLVGAAGVVLDSSQLAADALATRNRLDDLVDDDSSHRDMLAALEKQYDDLVEAEAEIATSNDLTDELEAFLRSQNDDD